MGLSQQHYQNWQCIQDIIDYSCSLDKHAQLVFFIVFSTVSWTIWKSRNDLCFQNRNYKTFISVILMIIALANYWTGMDKRQAHELVPSWLPEDIDAIRLPIWDPEDTKLVLYQPLEDEEDSASSSA